MQHAACSPVLRRVVDSLGQLLRRRRASGVEWMQHGRCCVSIRRNPQNAVPEGIYRHRIRPSALSSQLRADAVQSFRRDSRQFSRIDLPAAIFRRPRVIGNARLESLDLRARL